MNSDETLAFASFLIDTHFQFQLVVDCEAMDQNRFLNQALVYRCQMLYSTFTSSDQVACRLCILISFSVCPCFWANDTLCICCYLSDRLLQCFSMHLICLRKLIIFDPWLYHSFIFRRYVHQFAAIWHILLTNFNSGFQRNCLKELWGGVWFRHIVWSFENGSSSGDTIATGIIVDLTSGWIYLPSTLSMFFP